MTPNPLTDFIDMAKSLIGLVTSAMEPFTTAPASYFVGMAAVGVAFGMAKGLIPRRK